jgi:hypothetical protein
MRSCYRVAVTAHQLIILFSEFEVLANHVRGDAPAYKNRERISSHTHLVREVGMCETLTLPKCRTRPAKSLPK